LDHRPGQQVKEKSGTKINEEKKRTGTLPWPQKLELSYRDYNV